MGTHCYWKTWNECQLRTISFSSILILPVDVNSLASSNGCEIRLQFAFLQFSHCLFTHRHTQTQNWKEKSVFIHSNGNAFRYLIQKQHKHKTEWRHYAVLMRCRSAEKKRIFFVHYNNNMVAVVWLTWNHFFSIDIPFVCGRRLFSLIKTYLATDYDRKEKKRICSFFFFKRIISIFQLR